MFFLKSLLFFGLFSLGTFLFQNCSNVILERSIDETKVLSQGKGNFCVSGDGRTRINKILFVVDKSGSNGLHNGRPGTDPDMKTRVGSIMQYLEQHTENTFFRWGLIAFQGSGTDGSSPLIVNYIHDASGAPVFGSAAQLSEGIDKFKADRDFGGTPYMAALGTARTAIENDLKLSNPKTENSIYNIFFLSDGMPSDLVSSATSPNGAPAEKRHFDLVASLISLAPKSIFFSTVFYSVTPDAAAAEGLREMARVGNGKFVNLTNNEKIDFESLMLGPLPQSYVLRQFHVYNLNSAFCENGQVGVDSDSDGLCDVDELAYNERFAKILADPRFQGKKFSPLNRNSFDPNFSDYFVLRKKVLPSGDGLPECPAGSDRDEDHDLLNDCEEALLTAVNPTGRTPDWTKDMKSRGGTADPKNPDSDGDGFIDGLEFFTFGLLSSAVNYNNIFEIFAGSVRGADIMEQHRHYKNPARANASTYDTLVLPTGFNDRGESCYSYEQKHLELFPSREVNSIDAVRGHPELMHKEGENVILMYYIAALENDPNGSEVSFRFSYQKLNYSAQDNGQQLETLNTNTFETYETPESQ